jgi:hypothetical protein
MPRSALQGALLGATVGAGFAAFESAGYAFNAAITTQGISLASLLQTEAVRAILTPVGHVVWTAILGAAVFGASQSTGRIRASLSVVVVYVGVAVLHALWDSMSGIASLLALVITGNSAVVLDYGFLPPTAAQAVSALATTLYIVGIVVVGLLGVLAIAVVLRSASARARDHSGFTAEVQS